MLTIPRLAYRAIVILTAATFLSAVGCVQQQRRTQLERVAKDWCETIRASQVIPVYPLTEDLRPGDVFLVQRPIGRQQEEWKAGGYLTLDDHRVRLGYDESTKPPPDALAGAYKRMYFNGYWKDVFGLHPNPRPVITAPGPVKPGEPLARLSDALAPRAAFPSYSFEVRSGAGLSLAIPIKGVPIGLSFMESGNADGMVTISDAYTYGADAMTLYTEAMTWATSARVSEMLDGAARQAKAPVFLRVVSRVYLTGSVSVSLVNRESGGGGLQAGAKQEVKIFDDQTGDVKSGYTNLLKTLDESANAAPSVDVAGKVIPGGAVKFAWASGRSIALSETFDKPLIIGYLGFDIPVFAGVQEGVPDFGFPLPTWAILNSDLTPPTEAPVQDVNRTLGGAGLVESGTPGGLTEALRVMQRTSDRVVAENVPDTQPDAMKAISAKCGTLMTQTDPAARAAGVKQLFDIQFVPQAAVATNGRGGRQFDRILNQEYSKRGS